MVWHAQSIPKYCWLPEHLGGTVYRISDTHVTRVLPNWELWDDLHPCPYVATTLDSLGALHAMAEEAHAKGLNVPQSYGLHLIPMRDLLHPSTLLRPRMVPGLVSEYIPGIPFGCVKSHALQEAMRQQDDQLKRARQCGFEPCDSEWWDNMRWSPRDQKLYFVDLDKWSRRF